KEQGFNLKIKIGLGAGNILISSVGGVFGRWEFLISGPLLSQVAVSEQMALPDEVIISPQAWDIILQSKCRVEPVADGHFRLKDVSFPFPVKPSKTVLITDEIEERLWHYIPKALRSYLQVNQIGWVA